MIDEPAKAKRVDGVWSVERIGEERGWTVKVMSAGVVAGGNFTNDVG